MWTSGPQEAVMLVSFKDEAKIQIKSIEESLRGKLADKFPDCNFTFEAGDIVNKVMNFGASTPIQVDIDGPNYEKITEFTYRVLGALKPLSCLRDVEIVDCQRHRSCSCSIDIFQPLCYACLLARR
jgi:hypothetical protein